jgi:NAD(P)-dependent dehydrogenase (short-subunit alcohol dehydrogenase family)
MTRSAVILGARNLGGAIVDRLLADGWHVAAIARSDATLTSITKQGALALQADAAEPRALTTALETAARHHGGLDLIVNAVHPHRPPPGSPLWGGPLATMDLATYQGWGSAVAEQAYVFLHTGINALRANGGGSLIQITGGSAVRAAAGRGAWAAGCSGTRALVLSAVEELKDEPIDPYLLVIDGKIEGRPEQDEIAATVAHLAQPRAHRRSPEVHLLS